MSATPAVSRPATEPRCLAGIIGGHAPARHIYRLGAARVPDGAVYVVTLIDEVPGIGMTFEARSFEHAFARALVIARDMAESAGHLDTGVMVSVEEFHDLAEIGIRRNNLDGRDGASGPPTLARGRVGIRPDGQGGS